MSSLNTSPTASRYSHRHHHHHHQMKTPSKVKELDDEDYSYQAMQEPLYRVETGNYEYRLLSKPNSVRSKGVQCIIKVLAQNEIHLNDRSDFSKIRLVLQ